VKAEPAPGALKKLTFIDWVRLGLKGFDSSI
jgi:hypothetical protein